MHYVRRGSGKPLLLVHGLGGSHHSWDMVVDALAMQRDLVIVDLPGFSITPPLPGEVSIATLSDAVTAFLAENGLTGIDAVGSSMGARLVLELARRGVVGNVVSLDPGGFWKGWERTFFGTSIAFSIRLVRLLQPILPTFATNPVLRSILFAQFSSHPWDIPADVALRELRTFAASPSFDPLLKQLVDGPPQGGTPHPPGRIVIGWGRQDRVCIPTQAARAGRAFPTAEMHWFKDSGHFPQWDTPEETVQVILQATL